MCSLVASAAQAQPRHAPAHKPAGADSALARARALDKEGAKAYADGRYNDAIRYFEEAHRLGGPPFELWNIAKCHLRLDQPEQAADYLERYLATEKLPPEDREEATQQLESLKKRPSTVTVSSTPSRAAVAIDGRLIENGKTPLSFSVPPGQHSITVTMAHYAPYTRSVEAKYGRAIILDAALEKDDRPPPPDNPYRDDDHKISLRGSLGVIFPRFGDVGGSGAFAFMAMGTYRLVDIKGVTISAGGLLSVNGDSWGNETGQVDTAPGCQNPLSDAHSATALSFFGIGHASFPIIPRLRAGAIAGVGAAGYFAGDNVGGDVFVPSCNPSPGVRPALMLGTQIDFALASIVRLSAWPLTWQVQPAFDGTRATPEDSSGVWMRFGLGIGAGVDL